MSAGARPERAEPASPDLKTYRQGTHRIRPPEATWEAIQPALRQAGVTRVADVTGLDGLGVPVMQAVRPASRNLSVSQGKGATPMAARVSAAMEALELWHAEDLSALASVASVVMTPREMRRAARVPLASLRWSADARAASARLEGAPLEWLPARALTGGTEGYLPRAMMELDFTPPRPLAPQPFDLTSNGLASGNSVAEAELHALCELIERHALALVERHPARAVPLREASIAEPLTRELLRRVRAHGGKAALRDCTWEAGVPVVRAEIALPDLPHVWRGSGCHPSPEVALSRALTEAAQSRLTYIAGARDDLVLLAGAPAAHDATAAFVEPRGERDFDALPDLSTPRVDRDRERVIERLLALGHEPFALDLVRPAVGVDVVFAFAPGLLEVRH